MILDSSNRVLSIFSELNRIPRPSHHEGRVADYLCGFARRLNLEYERDAQNCVVIRKPATPGYEASEPIVLLNHMDMVCVGMNDPMNDPVQAYVEDGWMRARGTSLGADNGIGLSMALAVLESDSIAHPALEVMTTTNEEDGMSGAAQLSRDFIRGRKVINLDSEDYDTITTGAAGACLQFHRIPFTRKPAARGRWYRISLEGGLGGHSGVDINKGRCSAVTAACELLAEAGRECVFDVASVRIGEANASIASSGQIVICVYSGRLETAVDDTNRWLRTNFAKSDPGMRCVMSGCEPCGDVIDRQTFTGLMDCLRQIPQGVVCMSDTMQDTVETSNNIGRIETNDDCIFVSTHTRSFIDADMERLSREIAGRFASVGAVSERVMTTPAWQEDRQSGFLQLTSDTFYDVLGWRPRMVSMHFVLEAGFFVQHYPGIQIASIGPRIVEPHSANERVELKTVQDIWMVLVELLKRLK